MCNFILEGPMGSVECLNINGRFELYFEEYASDYPKPYKVDTLNSEQEAFNKAKEIVGLEDTNLTLENFHAGG